MKGKSSKKAAARKVAHKKTVRRVVAKRSAPSDVTAPLPSIGSGEVAIFQSARGKVRLDVRLERESVWLSLNQMADLFGRDKSVISRHLQNVFKSRELQRPAVVAENATTAADGNKRIGTLLFLEYLRRNQLLLREDGQPRLADNSMMALALLVAESDPKHKELMIRLILNHIGDGA